MRGEIVAGTGLLYRGYRGYQVDTAGVAGKQDDTREPTFIQSNTSKNFSTELIYLTLTPSMLYKKYFHSIQFNILQKHLNGHTQQTDTHTSYASMTLNKHQEMSLHLRDGNMELTYDGDGSLPLTSVIFLRETHL